MNIVSEVLKSTEIPDKFKPINVEKHLDLVDVGNLLVVDKNELHLDALKKDKNEYLRSLTRDNLQLLLNDVWKMPIERVEESLLVQLPAAIFPLPRAKSVPKPKPLTKWQQFALEKGIKKKGKKAKLSWDDILKKWVPLYGYKKANVEKEKNWLIEVPQNADPFEDQFEKRKNLKTENIAKNELQHLHNVARAQNIKIPRTGLVHPDVSSSKDLQKAVTVSKSSTASLGKFQGKLPKEKEARGIAAITPGFSRKKRPAPVPVSVERDENIAVLSSVLSKKPKLDIEKVVNRQTSKVQNQSANENTKNVKKNKAGKKPKTTNNRKGKNGGRKRR